MYSKTFASHVYIQILPFYVNQIPALVAKGSIPPDAAFVQSTRVPAFCGKFLLLQTIAVLCTDGGVQ